MNQFRSLLFFSLALSGVSCSSTTAQTSSPAEAAHALNAQSQASLGVGVRSLAFLFDTDSGTYLAKDSVSLQNSWAQLEQLENAGYVKINTFPSVQGDLVQITLTPKGQAVANQLRGP